jgi:hypothetical protein
LTAGFLASTFLLITALRGSAEFARDVYLPFSRTVSGWLGALFSFSPYAAAEPFAVLAVACALFCAVRGVVRSVRERTGWPLLILLFRAAAFSAGAVFLFVLLWGGSYHAPKLEVRLGLHTGPADEEILYLTAARHLQDVARYAAIIPRNENGEADAGGFDALAPEAVRAVKLLMERDPELFGSAAVTKPKRVLSYTVLSMLGISGIYFPFTGEAIVNSISTDPFLPSVMAHEMAHRLGFAAEDEANFIAYLACMASDQPIFRYSGALMAYTYCYNAITDPVYKHSLWTQHFVESEVSMEDVRANREVWARHDGFLRGVSESVNDAYLQSMGQEDGVRSYGRVVDLLIALYLETNSYK